MDEVTVNIEAIMREIRETIEKEKKLDIHPFGAVSQEECVAEVWKSEERLIDDVSYMITQLRNDVRYLQSNYSIPYYWDLGRGLRGAVKRIVRRMIKCIAFNLVSYQNVYNSSVAKTSDAVLRIVEEQQKTLEQLKNEIVSQRQQNENLRKQLTKIMIERESFRVKIE